MHTTQAELPGIKKDDVKITLQEGVLTIEAERKVEESGEDKETKLHYRCVLCLLCSVFSHASPATDTRTHPHRNPSPATLRTAR
jgi:hypothetical protein